MKQCRNICHDNAHMHSTKMVGVYCVTCMAKFKAEKKVRLDLDAYARAVQNGAGDLWRYNT